MLRRTLVALVVLGLVVSCGGAPATCAELADETIDLIQTMIDEVEPELGDMSLEEIMAGEGELPSIERFGERADRVDERAAELGCSQAELRDLVGSRAGELESTTPIGHLIIDRVRSGGL